MKTALIAGASGLTGSYLVQLLLESNNYNYVKVLVRSPLNIEHPSLQQIVYDYENPDPEAIKADHVYCALGTTMKKAGSRAAFKKVDYEYPLKIAGMAHHNGAEKFALVSAMGANIGSFFFYNKVKGQLERDLKEIPFEAIYILRPSMLHGPRKEFRLGEELGKLIMKPLGFILPANMKSIHASQVAACMLDQMNRNNKGIHTISSGHMLEYPVRKEMSETFI